MTDALTITIRPSRDETHTVATYRGQSQRSTWSSEALIEKLAPCFGADILTGPETEE